MSDKAKKEIILGLIMFILILFQPMIVYADEVGANCVYAGHDINNPNSGRVMQKIGMKFEGILRQFGKNNQGIVDCVRYSMIKAER